MLAAVNSCGYQLQVAKNWKKKYSSRLLDKLNWTERFNTVCAYLSCSRKVQQTKALSWAKFGGTRTYFASLLASLLVLSAVWSVNQRVWSKSRLVLSLPGLIKETQNGGLRSKRYAKNLTVIKTSSRKQLAPNGQIVKYRTSCKTKSGSTLQYHSFWSNHRQLGES